MRVQQLVLTITALIGLAYANDCQSELYPVYAGGTQREFVNCFVYDPLTELIIVGGNTTSDDFAPAANDHGYLYALDLSGNWQWGKFFYNVSYAVSDISGCQLSSDGSSLSVLGMGNSAPVIMDMNTADGIINKYISLEYILTSSDVVPVYKMYGAVYNDKVDYFDGKDYMYAAFIMESKVEFLRLTNTNDPVVDWSYEFTDDTTTETADDLYRRKDPSFLHVDPKDDQVIYLSGRYYGRASVMRFQKRQAKLRWFAYFGQMTNIRAWAQVPDDEHFYVCGDYLTGTAGDAASDLVTAEYHAAVARMKNDGVVKWYLEITGSNPSGALPQDRCMGVAYNPETYNIAVVIQGKMSQLRSSNKGDFFDTFLFLMDQSGDVDTAVVISQGTLGQDLTSFDQSMYAASQGIVNKRGSYLNEDYYFAGWSYGFQTKYQELSSTATPTVKDVDSPDFDSYVYKYNFANSDTKNCLYEEEISNSDVRRRITKTSQSSIDDSPSSTTAGLTKIVSVWNENNDVPKELKQNYFIPYISRYSGGFALIDTMKIPRPCAFQSYNLTEVEYYRGQNTMEYDIGDKNSVANVITQMTDASVMIMQDGTSAANLAVYNQYKVEIQTDEDDMVGVQKTIIRDCDYLGRLLELNLYIEVLSNTHPDFVTEPDTSFTMAVGDVISYKLPPVVDPDGNDIPEVYIDKMDAQEEKYPPFLMFENSTNTITLKPDSQWVQGRTYYYTIIVKETNSDSVKYSFYCTVKITGEPIEQDFTINYTDINYTINYIDDNGRGSLFFTSPINMTWLSEEGRFYDMFRVYWRDTMASKTQEDLLLQDFIIDNYGEDNQTINFTMTFQTPYMIGLLLKKSDRLHIDIMEGFDITQIYVGNKTEVRLMNNVTRVRLEMIFDWDNPIMAKARLISKNMYWVIIGLIMVQFVFLIWRGVGLLPVWILIEYLQLVGFMPIYNFRLIPYLYDAFKPALVAHMIIFDETPYLPNMDKEYFNKNYEYYWLSVGRLAQSFFFVCVFFFCILIANLVVFLIDRANIDNASCNSWAKKKMIQFKFNCYIRYYMLVYFDTTFFAVMKIMEGNNSTMARKAALLLSYVLFVIAIILPVFLITHVNRRFEILMLKEAKQSFNTLLLKIDKASRWRVMNPAYFFARRLLTAMLLTLPIENTFIFLQYVFILMSSHAYILYMVACKPYQTPALNSYVLANETFYSALIIAIFIFSDATPELEIKFGAGVALIVSLILLVCANVIMNIYTVLRGPVKLKQSIKESKLRRAEKEALERAEEEERKLKKKKEEEEFTKIPDDTANMSQLDGNANSTTNNNTTLSELNQKGNKKNKKKKGMEDNVAEAGMGGVGQDDFPASKKRRRGKDKEKGKQDDLAEGELDQKPKKSKRRKQTDPTTTNQTDFGTNPTQKDLI